MALWIAPLSMAKYSLLASGPMTGIVSARGGEEHVSEFLFSSYSFPYAFHSFLLCVFPLIPIFFQVVS